eukprot:15467470-Alexandrium_andersonii.AAC.1
MLATYRESTSFRKRATVRPHTEHARHACARRSQFVLGAATISQQGTKHRKNDRGCSLGLQPLGVHRQSWAPMVVLVYVDGRVR